MPEIKIYNIFEEDLIFHWKNLYEKGGNYNLSFEWCNIWFKYFSKNRKAYIITVWKNEKLELLAPFYISGKTLSLIGTKPDLYDEFNILYENTKYLDYLFNYIEEKKLQLNFKHVNSESAFGKYLIKKFNSKGKKFVSCVTESKPSIKNKFLPNRKLKDDFKRCQNNVFKNFSENLEFDLSVESKKEYIQEFFSLHKKRWNGGLLTRKPNIDKFIENLFLDTSVITLSRLYLSQTNKTFAYHLGYKDSNNVFWSSMPAYNTEYKQFSPGKVLLFNLISKIYENEIKRFDFGRGSESYKNWFSDYDEILFNITTYNNKYYFKIRTLLDKILKLIYK